jgi:hypothetical protein
MLRSDEHHKILQMLEREAPQFGRDAGGVECGAMSAASPASSFQPPASRILDLTDVPDLLSLPVEPIVAGIGAGSGLDLFKSSTPKG